GQLYDAHSALHYNYFRDYDPETGRYVESDPIGLDGGLNTYGYAYQNPINNFDPDGRLVWFLGFGALGGAGTTATAGTGFWATGALLGGAVLTSTISGSAPTDSDASTESSAGSTAEKDAEHRRYHEICDQPPPPNLDECEFMRWKIDQLKQCIAARQTWDQKWNGDHSSQIQQKIRELRKWERRLENSWKCKNSCPLGGAK
ncbi:RHS repeat-associated core domain-containing protein, partial [Pseudomonas indica]|uniref:RHS repeat-associated core domain-containing protein n=1 Tax=Pseudomonas indica TaxID=137658 RepID=UPI0020D00D62